MVVSAIVVMPSAATRFNSIAPESDPGPTSGEELDRSASSTQASETLRGFDASHEALPGEYELPAAKMAEESYQGWNAPENGPDDADFGPGGSYRHHTAANANNGEPIPEPGTLALLGMGLMGAGWRLRRRS